jgi:cell division protein ZapA (FtsZ GTPase activity inhibitor)
MNEAKNYTIRIFNDQYIIQSDEPDELVHSATQKVDALIHEITDKNKNIDPKKVAVLAALRLASQLVHMEYLCDDIRRKEQELIVIVDSVC